MDCVRARLALSAELDGEAAGVAAAPLLAAHLARCPSCRGWQQDAVTVTRRVRLTSATPPPDLFERILLHTRPRARWLWVTRLRVVGLLLCAAGQLALSLPDLAGQVLPGASREADHGMHEVAVFGLALGIAFVAGALRPRLAAGLAWVCATAAGGLLVTALSDIIGDRTVGAHEAAHLVAIAGAVLLVWTARDQRSPGRRPSVLQARPLTPVLDDDLEDLDDRAGEVA